jgi:transcriptional regulator with PAS, ATPase and Fis domain
MSRLYAYSLVPVLCVSLLLFFSTVFHARGARGLAVYCLSIAFWSGSLLLTYVPAAAFLGQRFASNGALVAAAFLHAAYDFTQQASYALVGSDRPVHVDVRVVSATNRDLAELQARGEFREDLYWRIRGAEVRLPALRERPGDIPLLAAHFLNRAGALCADGRPKTLSERARAALLEHGWPGNLRELKFEMQRGTVLAGSRPAIEPEDFSFFAAGSRREPIGSGLALAEKIEALERREIEAALEKAHGNRTHAAEALGLSRQGLLKKLARYGLG